ncbi:hypothetical protein Moror_11997 [Moniliophthora roreri MCA 2997]|uniref:Protein kinase domain-containing protein n=2 Tax=Moniliophthora roreri TaxID=221103 RepID=V2Y5T2_MONRO|nr:hypothetical protein Moror_11997 [Moniliophthora roreri MCA 2997]KAI3599070.1 hypothetical protein WG66_004065 [Moniliophthora roreri]
MAFLQGSSNFAIHGGQFTNVQGSQHNYYGGVVVQQAAEKEWTMWDEYKRLRMSDIHLTRLVDGAGAARRDADLERGQRLRAHRIISVARVSGEKEDKEFLHVQYHGQDAYQEFERNFKQFSSIKHPYVAQLFGYNDNRHGFPALIFYDALIPLERIIYTRGRRSSILNIYFSYQLAMQQTLTDGHGHASMDELWVEPRSGALCRGPRIHIPLKGRQVAGPIVNPIRPESPTNHYFSPLYVQTYSDMQIVLEYLIRTLSTRNILDGIDHIGAHTTTVSLVDEAVVSMLRSFTAIYYRGDYRRTIAKWAKAEHQAPHQLSMASDIPDTIRKTQIVMTDGSIRFTVNLRDAPQLRRICAIYAMQDRRMLVYSWLTQAHYMFGQLGIPKDEWEDYSTFHAFDLKLHRIRDHARPKGHRNIGWPTSPVYLFIRPIPQSSDDDEIWEYWAKGRKYYWSFDDTGMRDQEISDIVEISLGLPSFTSEISAFYRRWDCEAYEAVEKLHSVLGFDSATTDLARSLGLPFFHVIGNEDRFEDCDEDSMATISDILDSYNVTEEVVNLSVSDSEDIDSEEEIVVYPRRRLGSE